MYGCYPTLPYKLFYGIIILFLILHQTLPISSNSYHTDTQMDFCDFPFFCGLWFLVY